MSSIRSRAPIASSQSVRRVMRSIASEDTKPELLLCRGLHALGYRYRVNACPVANVRCKADLLFTGAKVCILVDGCFWHGCAAHFALPKSNSDWWLEKITENQLRDKRQLALLVEHGWIVVRFWEHHVSDNLSDCIASVRRAIRTTSQYHP